MSHGESNGSTSADPSSLLLSSFDPKRGGIVCKRVNGLPMTNVPMRVVCHSPDGPEWGYGGSGPADLALNYLHAVFPIGCDGEEPVKLWKGRCSRLAWRLHQPFKWKWIATLPHEGGVLNGHQLRTWVMSEACALEDWENEPLVSVAIMEAWFHRLTFEHGDRWICHGCGDAWEMQRGEAKERLEAILSTLIDHIWECSGKLLKAP